MNPGHLIFLLVVIFHLTAYGQNSGTAEIVQTERIQTSDCANSSDVNCTQKSIEEAILPLLEKHIREFPVDTLSLNLKFTVSRKGELDEVDILLNVSKSALSEKLKRRLEKILQNLAPYTVSNFNSGNYPSWHRFYFQYAVLKRENQLKSTAIKRPYLGGVVLKIPLFPTCPRENPRKDQQCFQRQMQTHIESHFKYPEAAMRQGIQGVVYIHFNIDEQGGIADIKMKGPHWLLTTEARRIVSLLPRFQPAMENENPVSIPYSIPITFNLN